MEMKIWTKGFPTHIGDTHEKFVGKTFIGFENRYSGLFNLNKGFSNEFFMSIADMEMKIWTKGFPTHIRDTNEKFVCKTFIEIENQGSGISNPIKVFPTNFS